MGDVLVVDDEAVVLSTIRRALEKAGHHVLSAGNAKGALNAIATARFDVIVSDIAMPELSGIDVLREVRKKDADIPVILMTGDPRLESAIAALELGAFKYVSKPFELDALIETVTRAARIGKLARAKRQALQLFQHEDELLGDTSTIEERFEAALDSLWLAFQPIVKVSARRVMAYEALLRTEEATLRNPEAFLAAAERLGRLKDLGRKIRRCAFERSRSAPSDVDLFVNLHPRDLLDDDLVNRVAPLSHIASRVVLEVTERASLDGLGSVKDRIDDLRRLGFRIAVDDLGAGYAGLTSLTSLEPEVAKLDMSLVRNIDADDRRKRVVESLIGLCGELGMVVVVEGIETSAERDTLCRLGADVMQGYYYAKPAREIGELIPLL